MTTWATAFAPASVGNVGVGFDVLGHALGGVGDRATVRRTSSGRVAIRAIRGVVTELPSQAEKNTAGRALLSLLERVPRGTGFDLELEKGVALGSGMGGSAASAVAALVAANATLDAALPDEALYECALDGEAVASGSRHGDNVAPILLGGLVIAPARGAPVRVPVPDELWCALVHPHHVLETRRARAALAGHYELHAFVEQSEHLALVLAGCFTGDFALIRRGLSDVLIEPRRAPLVPGFTAVKAAALAAGALGASISGAGPSVFAWCQGRATAERATRAMQSAFRAAGLDADVHVSPVDAPGARVETCGS
ncbi:MAG: homoserine kinase [Planctomycetes bacterium]|nr:homoserine kinase [Planctomycetota bacterium]